MFRAELIGCERASWEELFAGYTGLKAITFSSSIEFPLHLADRPEPPGSFFERAGEG